MTAPNHALAGALIGLTVANPFIGIPLAIVSHFILDTLPHYDPPGSTTEKIIGSKQFLYVQLIGGAALCFLLVLLLAIFRPHHWVIAAFCAFFATSPDLLSLPRFISVKRGGRDIKDQHWFWRFHVRLQGKTAPRFIGIELIWFIVFATVLAVKL